MTGDPWHATGDTWHWTSVTWHFCFCPFWYWCYFPHSLRDSVSLICRIFNRPGVANNFNNALFIDWLILFLQIFSTPLITNCNVGSWIVKTMFTPHHVSHVMLLIVTCNTSHVTLHVTCHVSLFFLIFFLFTQSGGARQWRLCYQRDLHCQVLKEIQAS